eukprot:TRINITY_DN26435_c0_g1_i1.p1 TRINITY_DN26435_c0_g1~~TRINITY_DN26435_c0_g1_i1.p1  ORF type:complete len:1109 (+),score=199.51 TRINITY_DN26435_c0_g1_i1:51-3377(+)
MTTMVASLLFPLLLLFPAASGNRQRESGLVDLELEHLARRKVPGNPEEENLLKFWGIATGLYVAACLIIVGAWALLIVPREQEALDEIDDDEEETGATTLGFGDPSLDYRNISNVQQKQRKRFKQQWLQENSGHNVSLGASTLFMASCALIFYRIIRLVEQPLKMQTLWGLLFCEFAFLLASAAVSFRCIHKPNEMYYWPVLLASMFYTLFMHLPPLAWSCTELVTKYAGERHWYIEQALHNTDCSPQGSTAQQVLMTWMLLTPWLIPRFKMMYLLWTFVAVYLIVSLLYRKLLEQESDDHKGVLSAFSVGSSVFYMGVALVVATAKKFYMEKSQRNKFVNVQQRQQASGKLYEILEYMVPAHVIIPMLKAPGSVISEYVDCASILFIVIEDFDRFASTKTPEDLLIFLNEQFTRIDEICAENRVTKIETVGEEYVACVGVVPADKATSRSEGHGHILERLFRAAEQILALQTEEVQFKMGLHTGPIKAGVIGHKLPRYRLFGDTINTAARMMQKSSPGKLQLSEATAAYCKDRETVRVKDIGKIEMKGKGMVQAYHFESIVASSRSNRMLNRSTTSSRGDDSVRARLLNRMPLVGGLLKGGGLVDAFSSEDAEDIEDKKFGRERLDFKTILKQMEEGDDQKTNFILSQKRGFTPEMEQDWYMWFHTNTVCKKLAARMDRQTIVVSLLTIVEALYISTTKSETKQSRYDFTKFLACRLTIVLIMMALRAFSGSTQWIHRNPFGGQTLLLITSIVTSGIFFASYDAMAMPSQNFNLSFMLVYFLASRQYNLLFYPSLTFIAFALVLMGRVDTDALLGNSDDPNGDSQLYYSCLGQGLFVALSCSNAVVAHDEEQSSRLRYKALKAVELTQDRIDRILRTLMPPLVVQGMRPGEPHRSHHYKLATIAQSDLCGFTKLASSKSPAEVVGFISDLFGLFDLLTDVHKVYKIETVGDAYIAGMAEQPLTEQNSPLSVLLFGLDMVVETDKWAKNLGVNVTCRVGVHHGECTGGIVGNDMQRYHLFGELLTSLDILESTSVEGRVQISLKAKDAVEAQLALTNPNFQAPTADLLRRLVTFERRTVPQLVTSKGETHEYNKVGGITFLVSEQPGK